MPTDTTPDTPVADGAHEQARAPSRSTRPRTAARARHLEAYAASWLRALREGDRLRAPSARAGHEPVVH